MSRNHRKQSKENSAKGDRKSLTGIDGFIQSVRQRADETKDQQRTTTDFILHISDDYAFIRLRDLRHPIRFLKQLSGAPPVRFGTRGFRPDIVDDRNPARHYIAFVFVGYWLPMVLGWLVLMAWEILGYFRYGFQWSSADVRCGVLGLRHGRKVWKQGADVLPELIEQELKAR